MTWLPDTLVLLTLLLGSALFSGTETAFYRVSRVRLDMEAHAGGRNARLVQRLLRDQTALVIVLLLGNNLCLEFLTWRFEHVAEVRGVTPVGVDVLLSFVLVPVVFFLGELLPKDLFRRRPHAALALMAPVIAVMSVLFWPLVRVLALLARLVPRAAGSEGLSVSAQGRESVLGFIEEGRRSGAIQGHAEEMAANVLQLRSISVERCMVHWRQVVRVDAAAADAVQYAHVAASQHTRIPMVDERGACLGYLHQLDVLGEGEGCRPADHLRPVESFPPDLSVDRALARLRAAGQRLALVGPRENPVGIITLKDLLEEISGDLARW